MYKLILSVCVFLKGIAINAIDFIIIIIVIIIIVIVIIIVIDFVSF